MLPNITYLNICNGNILPSLQGYDAVYICGGNTYYILDRIRKTGLDSSIKKFVRKGGLYIGVSAGSIIAGENIEIAGWGTEGDINDINLKDLRGLGFTKIAVFPNYKSKLKSEVEEFRSNVAYPVESIKDKEAIIILGKNLRKFL
ncbi:MAG: Type 1 glutamine amidotransferase-like domain-containing protein [Candidatus Pacearchaeota archaeon]